MTMEQKNALTAGLKMPQKAVDSRQAAKIEDLDKQMAELVTAYKVLEARLLKLEKGVK